MSEEKKPLLFQLFDWIIGFFTEPEAEEIAEEPTVEEPTEEEPTTIEEKPMIEDGRDIPRQRRTTPYKGHYDE